MPRRDDLETIMVLGSGPIKIGQAAEFDFSGSQAVRALREDGYKVILVNSNPATIQNDPEMADIVYIEPLLPETIAKILEKERPCALLAGMGGQTALNIASELSHNGTLERLGVELIGSDLDAIDKAEDRELFNQVCESINLPISQAVACNSIDEVIAAAELIGSWPILIRPAFTLGGLGGGTARDMGELVEISQLGLRNSRISQVLIEESILGWQELEYEVMRDEADNATIVCTMENIDPMGVHTGESTVVAPLQSFSDADHQRLRNQALALIRALNIKGGCNVQFAFNQFTGEIRVIEVNPRVSRSSALASKATGYPIARMAAKIAVGYTLDELPNPITGEGTTAAFEPTLDYCVVKIPRWPFDKFRTADRTLGTSMKSTGEVMAIGRNFEEAFLKAWASLEQGCAHPRPLTRADESEGEGMSQRAHEALPDATLVDWLAIASDRRMGALLEAFRRDWGVEKVHEITRITRWFLYGFERLAKMERSIVERGVSPAELTAEELRLWRVTASATLTSPMRWPVSHRKASNRWRPDRTSVPSCSAATNSSSTPSIAWLTRVRRNLRPKPRTTTRPTSPTVHRALTCFPTWRHAPKNVSWPSAAAPSASVKALNSTTAACTPSKRFVKQERTPSSSTTTPKRSQRTLTRRTDCISIR